MWGGGGAPDQPIVKEVVVAANALAWGVWGGVGVRVRMGWGRVGVGWKRGGGGVGWRNGGVSCHP